MVTGTMPLRPLALMAGLDGPGPCHHASLRDRDSKSEAQVAHSESLVPAGQAGLGTGQLTASRSEHQAIVDQNPSLAQLVTALVSVGVARPQLGPDRDCLKLPGGCESQSEFASAA